MKVHEYNEMMAYMLRPQPKKEIQVASLMDEYLGDQKEYQKAVDEGFQGTFEEYLRMKSLERKELEVGGRVGFSEGTKPFKVARGKRKGLYAVRSRLNVDDVADAVDSSTDYIYFENKTDADNFYNSLARRGSETYIGKENFIKERKKFPKLNVDEFAKKMNELGYTDAGGNELDGDRIRQYHGEFNVPLDKEAYKPKAPGAKKTRASDDPQRLKEIDDYVKEFEKEYGKKPTKKNVVDALQEQTRVMPIYEKTYGVTLPTGSGAKLTNVEKDINKILKNKKIINKLDAGKFPTITDISKITGLDVALSETRLVDLAEKLRENPKYKKIADDYLDQPGLTNLDEGFGGRKRKRSRTILENRFVKLMGLDKKLPSLRSEILRKIQSFIPELKGLLAVDEIAGITSSMRRGSGPYAIFGQVLGGDFNTQVKGHGIDKDKGNLEKKLINLGKDDPQRLVEQEKYNKAVTDFEDKANKNNPAKKVRGLKLSFKPPSQTIKNKKVYNQYKDLFDAHYEKYGYSFEVPADRDSLVDISKKLDNKSFQNTVKNRFKNLIGKGGKLGVGVGLATLAGTGFALADDQGQTKEIVAGPFDYLEKDPSFIEEYPYLVGTTAAASPLLTKTGRKIYGGVLKGGLKAFGSVPSGLGFSASQFVDINPFSDEFGELQEDPNIGLAGADLLLPELGKRVAGSGTGILARAGRFALNPFQALEGLGRFGRAGRIAAMGARIPSLMTPVGLGLMGIEGVMMGMREQERINQMRETDPEAYQEYLADQEDMLRESAAYGGRMGFDEGGPSDPSKRKFMKIMGGLASLPVVGKFFRFAEQTPVVQNVFTEIQKLKNSETIMPDWFPTFLDKFRREGVAENIFKKKKVEVSKAEYDKAFAEGRGQDYYTDVGRTQEYKANNPDHMDYYKLEDTDQLIGTTYTNEKVPGVKVDDFDGEVSVNWENDYSQPVSIEYVKPGAIGPDMGRVDKFQAGIEKRELKPEGEFAAVDQEVYATDPDGGFDTNAIIVQSLDDMMEGTTRVMEEYATGKPVRTLSKGEGKVIEAEVRAEQAAESAAEMADDFDDF